MTQVEIIIQNKIQDKIKDYKRKYGTTKTWMAEQMGYNSLQAFGKAIKNESNSLLIYAKFAYFLKCNISELYEVTYKNKSTI